MRLRRKTRAFFRLSRADRLLVCEAVILLAAARVSALIVPFRVMARWLARAPDTGVPAPQLVNRIRNAVVMAARNVPWNAVCLPQALAAKAMLARRGVGSAFHLGATIEPDGRLSAHAWLESGGEVVTGAWGMRGMAHLVRIG